MAATDEREQREQREQCLLEAVKACDEVRLTELLQAEPGLAACPAALYTAVAAASPEMVKLLISYGADVNAETDDYTPLLVAARLGFVDVLEVFFTTDSSTPLDILTTTPRDRFFKVGFAPIYCSAGRNALHVAVESHAKSALRWLLAALPTEQRNVLLSMTDSDGCTPQDLAAYLGFDDLADVFAAAGVQLADKRSMEQRSEWLRAMRARVSKATQDRLIKDLSVAAARISFCPSLPFREFNREVVECQVPFFNLEWASLVSPVCPGVHRVKLFTDEGFALLCEEVASIYRHSDQWGSEAGLRRPNSMNNYGFVLGDLGYQGWLQELARTCLWPMATHHGVCSGLPPSPGFASVHGFVIRYRQGEDTDLKAHYDDSEFTFNVCLGHPGFVGATLCFQGADGEAFRYDHEIGTAVFHRGQIWHSVEQLIEGERTNLVVWCKRAPQAYVQPRRLSRTSEPQ